MSLYAYAIYALRYAKALLLLPLMSAAIAMLLLLSDAACHAMLWLWLRVDDDAGYGVVTTPAVWRYVARDVC